MASITKLQMFYKDYDWTAAAEHDNAKIIGFPDSALLARKEGYEVLPFINRYMTAKGWTQVATFNKIEISIREQLPGTTRSHSNVRKWLDDNFKLKP